MLERKGPRTWIRQHFVSGVDVRHGFFGTTGLCVAVKAGSCLRGQTARTLSGCAFSVARR
jgi:hypothetical protein